MVFPETKMDELIAYAGGGDGSMIWDHEFIFVCFPMPAHAFTDRYVVVQLNGDLNYRIDQRRDAVVASIRAGDLNYLLCHDQLLKEIKNNRSFRLRMFKEPAITFAPTYKYDRKSNEYDTSEKKRIPAWCDRILYRCRDPKRVEALHYQRYEVNVSDHRPVSAAFTTRVRQVDREALKREEGVLEDEWGREQLALVVKTVGFYKSIGMA